MPEKCKVTFRPENKTVEVDTGTTILEAAILNSIFIASACGGIGKCGKCRVKVEGTYEPSASESISDKDRKEGYVLACLTKITGDLVATIPEFSRASKHQILTEELCAEIECTDPLVKKVYLELETPTLDDHISDFCRLGEGLGKHVEGEKHMPLSLLRNLHDIVRAGGFNVTVTYADLGGRGEIIDVEPGDTTDTNLGLAVDVGTTTVVASLVDLNTGETLETASSYNKQIALGEDVIARIDYAGEEKDGLDRLRGLIIGTINELIGEMGNNDNVFSAVLSGNTTMTHLLLGLSPENIRKEPYIPVANIPPHVKAKELGINIHPEAVIYLMPSRASFVGGDITSDILVSGMHKRDELALLIDVGTNGEIVLGNKDWLAACSCSAGPAFEGGEVKWGMRAAEGAIEKVAITRQSEGRFNVYYETIGGGKPKGICGSGLIDLLSEMFDAGIIDKAGRIGEILSERIREADGQREFVVVRAKDADTDGRDIVITEADIKNIINTKAAVFSASYVLLKSMDLEPEALDRIYIAGGFGNYLDLKKSVRIGLFPDVPFERFQFLGNASLSGAKTMLLSREKKEEAMEIFRNMTYIELSTNKGFFDEFTSAMFIPHTDIGLFPSLRSQGIRK